MDVASTSHAEGIEDRATMAPLAARRRPEHVALGRRIVALELVVAAQAVDLRGARPLGRGTAAWHELVRSSVPRLETGDTVPDVEPLIDRLGEDPLPGLAPAGGPPR
jgi:histidine ammonia-lyase